MEKEGLIGMAVVGGATLALGGKISRKVVNVKSRKKFGLEIWTWLKIKHT